ncbi:MAG TPA: hypothetical protein PLZ08_04660 [Bacillota bacterium]|nr:hypothetical protein [Bacillota bacterium]HOL10752.1 hypothetical protein [Bacillota bacterium]HPO97233.1 hypothetical protein [Bacillota bacterium]
MKRIKLILISGLLLLCLLSGFAINGASAAENSKLYDYPKDGFSIRILTSMREIPSEVIKEYVEYLHANFPNTRAENYNYGFQLKSSKNWFEYPYILIQVKNQNRISSSELKKLKQVNTQQLSKKAQDKLDDNLGGVVSNVNFNEMVYDPINQIVWMRFKMTVQGSGNVVGISGMCLTEVGWIQVNCYCRESETKLYQGIFEDIIRSVQIANQLKYKG